MRIARLICSLLLAVGLLTVPAQSRAQVAVGISVRIGPPELPIYEQPLCPGEGYIWTPGYWAWGDDDYFWVPGTWVLVPEPGFFWTPGYWAWSDGSFIFYEGYWGPVVGFYGGINYGYGYVGHGYEGGRWDNGRFYYNRSVNNVNITEIHNVYNTTVVNNTTLTRVSYNGGNGGINVRPTPQEEAAAREKHIAAVPAQVQHVQAARANQDLRASANHGKPPVAATPRPGALNDRGVVPAREGGRYNPPTRSETNTAHPSTETNTAHPNTAVHPNELPAVTRPPASSTGNPDVDKKYQQQQEKLQAQQDKERQKLQQKQEQEHQRMAQQKENEAKKQQLEQQHQQQTQQLQQKHAQQQQKLQERQQQTRQNPNPPPKPPKEKP